MPPACGVVPSAFIASSKASRAGGPPIFFANLELLADHYTHPSVATLTAVAGASSRRSRM